MKHHRSKHLGSLRTAVTTTLMVLGSSLVAAAFLSGLEGALGGGF